MAAPTPSHNHGLHHHHHLRPSLLPAIPSRPFCCCCCVRRILHHQHHHLHHQLFHAQARPPWTPPGFPPFLVPRPGVSPPPNLFHRGDRFGATAQDAVEAEGTLRTSEGISSNSILGLSCRRCELSDGLPTCICINRLQEGTWEENFEGEEGVREAGEEEEQEEEEAVYVLTDEWAEFFAKSEAKRQLERKRKKQQQKGSI